MSHAKIAIRTEYSKDYRRITATSFALQLSESGFELTAFADENDFTPQEMPQKNSVYIHRTIETRLIVNPMQAKALYELFGNNLQAFEHLYGKIPSPSEVQQRASEMQAKNPQAAQSNTAFGQSNFGVQ